MNISYNYPTLVNNNKPRMSQIFKTNSRFDALIADVDIDNKPNGSNRPEPEKNTDSLKAKKSPVKTLNKIVKSLRSKIQ